MIPRHLLIGIVVMIALALGIALYLGHVRRHVERADTNSANTQVVAPPISGPTEQVTLYVAYDADGLLHARATRIPLPAGRQERAQELLRALLNIYLDRTSPHPLGPGSEVREVYMVDPGLAVIDLNAAFADGHRSGILVEELTLASLGETVAANIPGIARIKILIDGKERETLAGHVDLMRFYDISGIQQLAAQLQ